MIKEFVLHGLIGFVFAILPRKDKPSIPNLQTLQRKIFLFYRNSL